LGISAQAEALLCALADARAARPELAPLLDFYAALWRWQFAAREALTSEVAVPDEAASRLAAGRPLLDFAPLPIEPVAFARLAQGIAALAHEHNPTWGELPDEPTAAAWLDLARDVFQRGTTPAEAATAADLPALASGLALAPYLEHAAAFLRPHLDDALWQRPYCPVCGGRPDLALLHRQSGARYLVCARCQSQWLYRRVGCPFCGQEEVLYYPSPDEVYRLYVCDTCHRYLKTVDLRQTGRKVEPRLERLLTVGLDMAAQGQGYH